MSDFQHKENSGSIFKNDKREKDTSPHMKGSGLIGGVEYWISAWTNTTQSSGERYQGLKFQRKDEVHKAGMADAKAAIETADHEKFTDDQIPF